jgi:chromosome segregation ATPase
MLTASRLEKIMELENELRAQYQEQLDAKQAEIDRLIAAEAELQATIEKQQSALEKQKNTLAEMSGKAADTAKIEQQNRELANRSEKQTAEIAELKKRVKALQKDLVEVREENKTLNQYDPPRMKKNLDASKKKLAEKTKGNEALQKSLNQTKKENLELQQKVAELEAKVAELEPTEDAADVSAETDAASTGEATGEKAAA